MEWNEFGVRIDRNYDGWQQNNMTQVEYIKPTITS